MIDLMNKGLRRAIAYNQNGFSRNSSVGMIDLMNKGLRH